MTTRTLHVLVETDAEDDDALVVARDLFDPDFAVVVAAYWQGDTTVTHDLANMLVDAAIDNATARKLGEALGQTIGMEILDQVQAGRAVQADGRPVEPLHPSISGRPTVCAWNGTHMDRIIGTAQNSAAPGMEVTVEIARHLPRFTAVAAAPVTAGEAVEMVGDPAAPAGSPVRPAKFSTDVPVGFAAVTVGAGQPVLLMGPHTGAHYIATTDIYAGQRICVDHEWARTHGRQEAQA